MKPVTTSGCSVLVSLSLLQRVERGKTVLCESRAGQGLSACAKSCISKFSGFPDCVSSELPVPDFPRRGLGHQPVPRSHAEPVRDRHGQPLR